MAGRYLIFSIHYNFQSGIWQKKKEFKKNLLNSLLKPPQAPFFVLQFQLSDNRNIGQVRFATTITQISHAFSSAPSRLQNLLHSILYTLLQPQLHLCCPSKWNIAVESLWMCHRKDRKTIKITPTQPLGKTLSNQDNSIRVSATFQS